MRLVRWNRWLAALMTGTAIAAQAAAQLPKLNIDKSSITVSGLSAGGFMANQLGTAYSDTFKGVGVFAGGPYMCAGHNFYTACMYNAMISPSMLSTMQADLNNWSGSAIDNKASLASQKIFMFVGNSDLTVGPNPMNALYQQYLDNGVSADDLEYVRRDGAAHVFPTDFDGAGNNPCGMTTPPYISNCGYDGAKAVLSKFYGTLNPRNDAPAESNYVEFDQTAFIQNPGAAPTGWLYVPANCAAGTQCRLHVALHGCKQDYANVGDKFLKNTGYSRWADTNNIVVLFPQARADNTMHNTTASSMLPNPNACWDWVGWYDNTFAQKTGVQVSALKAMVDQVSSGTGGGGSDLPAPTGVTTSGATDNSMVISWSAVTGASGYNVYRGSRKVNASLVTETSFTDTGLSPGTAYSWTVRAVDAAGAESAASNAATGTTTGGSGGGTGTCTTASNYAHTFAGRAHVVWGITYANGSNQAMGLWSLFVTTTLKKTGPNYYVIGTCP